MIFTDTAETITLHGLGFLQIKLGGKQRLHVWHPELPRRRCFRHSAIHSHRFGFVSRVLVGVQINHNVEVTQSMHAAVPFTHYAYLHEGERTAFGNRPWIKDCLMRVREIDRLVVAPGDEYVMEPYAFHWTEPGGDGRVATLMTKTLEGNRGSYSLCEIDVDPDVDFDRKQWPESRLWAIANEVLGSGAGLDQSGSALDAAAAAGAE